MTMPLKAKSYWWWKAAADSRYARFTPLFLSILTGALAAAAWHPLPTTVFIFFAFVPLMLVGELMLETPRKRQSWRFYRHSYLAHLVWNIGSTWWIWNASPAGAIMAILGNAALQSLPWLAYFKMRRGLGPVFGLCGLVVTTLLFEYMHLRWELTWPWLNIGNVFAGRPEWVQWYEWTGALGGSAWVLWANAAVFLGFCSDTRSRFAKGISWATALVLLGLTVSYCLYPWRLQIDKPGTEVVVVQPNIDPYTQKFEGLPGFIPFEKQVDMMWQISRANITPNTRWLLWPETAIDATLPEAGLINQPIIAQIRHYLEVYPDLNLVVGATTYHMYQKDMAPPAARFHQGFGYYEVYNSALLLRKGMDSVPVYHKSKLVPGVEGLPYPSLLKVFAINLGGTAGGLGHQNEREVFTSQDGRVVMGPAICYESAFGDFMDDFSEKGAQYLGIITNDAWWGDTPGHVQHLNLARLRAIESRRWMARSANTGISAFIDPLGKDVKTLGYGKQGALRYTVPLKTETTLYTRIGDEGVILFVVLMCGLTLWSFRRTGGGQDTPA